MSDGAPLGKSDLAVSLGRVGPVCLAYLVLLDVENVEGHRQTCWGVCARWCVEEALLESAREAVPKEVKPVKVLSKEEAVSQPDTQFQNCSQCRFERDRQGTAP
jgi:hypothetical protein